MDDNDIISILDDNGWKRRTDEDGRITAITNTSPMGETITIGIPEGQTVHFTVWQHVIAYDPDRHARDVIRQGDDGRKVRDIIADAIAIGRIITDLGDAFRIRFFLASRIAEQTPIRPKGRDELTGDTCRDLRAEVTGYITGYWQDAADGHPYYAMQHDHRSARDMALDYMHERYGDYLEGMAASSEPGTDIVRLITQAPGPVAGDTIVEKAEDAFDQMFDKLWPAERPGHDRLTDPATVAAALELSLNEYDWAGMVDDSWKINTGDLDALTIGFIDALTRIAKTGHKPGTTVH